MRALHRLLEDVTSLARLQGRQERRVLGPIDATGLLSELCEGLQPMAEEKALFLRFDGPPACPVEGDAVKIRRIARSSTFKRLLMPRDRERWSRHC